MPDPLALEEQAPCPAYEKAVLPFRSKKAADCASCFYLCTLNKRRGNSKFKVPAGLQQTKVSRLDRLDSVMLMSGTRLVCTGACRQVCRVAAITSSLLPTVSRCRCRYAVAGTVPLGFPACVDVCDDFLCITIVSLSYIPDQKCQCAW